MKQYKRYIPKKSVRSFRDLEVYQASMESANLLINKIAPLIQDVDYPFKEQIRKHSLDIPLIIARAHSTRFDSEKKGIDYLEDAMLKSNEMIVYLEQIRDLYIAEDNDIVLIRQLIDRYGSNRSKIFRLYKSWKRFLENKLQDNP